MKKNLNTSKELLIIVLIIIFLTSSVSSSAFATGDGIGSFDNKDEENTNTTSVKNSNLSDNESAPFNNNGLLDVDDAIDKDELVEVKVGESIEFEAEIEGYGTFVNNKVYEPIDQSEYATTTATITNNEKVADIELIGEEVTFDGNTATYKSF